MCFLTKYLVLWITPLTFLFGPKAAGTGAEADSKENPNNASRQSYVTDVLRILSADNYSERHQNRSGEIIRILLERTLCPQRIYEKEKDSNLVNVSRGERKNCTDNLARVKPSLFMHLVSSLKQNECPILFSSKLISFGICFQTIYHELDQEKNESCLRTLKVKEISSS